jgi:hypothetical protein
MKAALVTTRSKSVVKKERADVIIWDLSKFPVTVAVVLIEFQQKGILFAARPSNILTQVRGSVAGLGGNFPVAH